MKTPLRSEASDWVTCDLRRRARNKQSTAACHAIWPGPRVIFQTLYMVVFMYVRNEMVRDSSSCVDLVIFKKSVIFQTFYIVGLIYVTREMVPDSSV